MLEFIFITQLAIGQLVIYTVGTVIDIIINHIHIVMLLVNKLNRCHNLKKPINAFLFDKVVFIILSLYRKKK